MLHTSRPEIINNLQNWFQDESSMDMIISELKTVGYLCLSEKY